MLYIVNMHIAWTWCLHLQYGRVHAGQAEKSWFRMNEIFHNARTMQSEQIAWQTRREIRFYRYFTSTARRRSILMHLGSQWTRLKKRNFSRDMFRRLNTTTSYYLWNILRIYFTFHCVFFTASLNSLALFKH